MESKFWISKDGEKVLGKGPIILLKEVERFGSLSKAAKEISMSYSKAWSIIHRGEILLGFPLLESEVGGLSGGGSQLTSNAKLLIKNYENFLDEAEEYVEVLYNKYFSIL